MIRREGRVDAPGLWARFDAPVLAHNAELRKVMVHPGARGRGLARAVITALVDRAVHAGVEVLVLDVRGNNHGAQRLYAELGWTEYGRLPDFVAVGDDRWDRVGCYLDCPGRTRSAATARGRWDPARAARRMSPADRAKRLFADFRRARLHSTCRQAADFPSGRRSRERCRA